MTGQEVVQRTPQQELVAQVRSPQFKSQVSLVLPEHVSAEKFGRIFGTWLLENPEALDGAEPNSVMQSLLRCAEMGLMPDGRQAAIVAFFDKRKQAKIAQAMPMIGGIRSTAADFGWSLRTRVVYSNDEFSYDEFSEPPFHHVPVRPGGDRGEIIAAYAWAVHRDGRREYLPPIDRAYIDKVRAVSRMGDKGAWVEWEPQMWEKTAGHRLFDRLPLAESDRIKLMRAALAGTPADAVAAVYGPQARAALAPGETVDHETGEVTSAPAPADDGGRPAVSPGDQQAEGADPEAPPPPSAPSAPEVDAQELAAVSSELVGLITELGNADDLRLIAEMTAAGKIAELRDSLEEARKAKTEKDAAAQEGQASFFETRAAEAQQRGRGGRAKAS